MYLIYLYLHLCIVAAQKEKVEQGGSDDRLFGPVSDLSADRVLLPQN